MTRSSWNRMETFPTMSGLMSIPEVLKRHDISSNLSTVEHIRTPNTLWGKLSFRFPIGNPRNFNAEMRASSRARNLGNE